MFYQLKVSLRTRYFKEKRQKLYVIVTVRTFVMVKTLINFVKAENIVLTHIQFSDKSASAILNKPPKM